MHDWERYCWLSNLSCIQILLDGPGDLKFSDFGLSRIEGENIDELFQQFSEAGLVPLYASNVVVVSLFILISVYETYVSVYSFRC